VLNANASFDVCVVGAGPSGSVAGAKLAQLGNRVCLLERSVFPRAHVGESLTAGVWPVAGTLGIEEELRKAPFLRAGGTIVRCANPESERLSVRQSGATLLVDRGKFDALLQHCAAAIGASVRQPVNVRRCVYRKFDSASTQGTNEVSSRPDDRPAQASSWHPSFAL
jgi:flavin-dependent dehydrogenase